MLQASAAQGGINDLHPRGEGGLCLGPIHVSGVLSLASSPLQRKAGGGADDSRDKKHAESCVTGYGSCLGNSALVPPQHAHRGSLCCVVFREAKTASSNTFWMFYSTHPPPQHSKLVYLNTRCPFHRVAASRPC